MTSPADAFQLPPVLPLIPGLEHNDVPLNLLDALLEEGQRRAQQQLERFAASSEFAAKMAIAFGEKGKTAALKEAWIKGDFSIIPTIEIRQSADLKGAIGAFALTTNTIYLSREYLSQNTENPDAVAAVLLEEIGHAVDAHLNDRDTPGDEGALFSALVRGETIDAEQLQALKEEDDKATIVLEGQNITIEQALQEGTAGNDFLYGDRYLDHSSDPPLLVFQPSDDTLFGYGGNDFLWGDQLNDTLYGGVGDDYLGGGIGDDTLDGGEGHDFLDGGEGDDTLQGGEGNDKLYGDSSSPGVTGVSGNDVLDGGKGNDELYGGEGNDTLKGGEGDDRLYGNYFIPGEDGNDVLDGGEGNDALYASGVNNQLYGGSGNDIFHVWTGGLTTIKEKEGNDTLWIKDASFSLKKINQNSLGSSTEPVGFGRENASLFIYLEGGVAGAQPDIIVEDFFDGNSPNPGAGFIETFQDKFAPPPGIPGPKPSFSGADVLSLFGFSQGLDRWWATANPDTTMPVTWTVGIAEQGHYELRIDIENVFTQQWELSEEAEVEITLLDKGRVTSQDIRKPPLWGLGDLFRVDGIADLGYLESGIYQLTINGFDVPEEPVVEEVTFQLEKDGVKYFQELVSFFVADHEEEKLFVNVDLDRNGEPDLRNASNQQLAEFFAPILYFDNGEGVQGGTERHSVPLDVEDYPLGEKTWKDRLESVTLNDLIRSGDSQSIINLLDFNEGTPTHAAPGVIYASVLQHPTRDELAINYYFHYGRSNWADHGGANTHQGDWEGITLFLSQNNGLWEPRQAAFGQHTKISSIDDQSDGGTTFRWDYLSKDKASSHPHIYVGLGGHASFPKAGATDWFPSNTEYHRGNGVVRKPVVHYLPRVGNGPQTGKEEVPEWLLFPGKWGQQDEGESFFALGIGNDGVEGPVFQSLGFGNGQRWLNPWDWASGFDIPLIAQDDYATTSSGQAVTIDVLANDNYDEQRIQQNMAKFLVDIDREPVNGTVIQNKDGTFSYTPNLGFLGEDSFSYIVEFIEEGFFAPSYAFDVRTVTITVTSQKTENAINGTLKHDSLLGTFGNDKINGFAGNDTIAGGLGDDTIRGGDGDDVLRGDANSRSPGGKNGGDDIIYGGSGNDRIGGKGGNDRLYGDEGNDHIWGDHGDDLLSGGLGNDTLTGGKGDDIFVLAPHQGIDTITDFKVKRDFIDLTAGLTLGSISWVQQGKDTLLIEADSQIIAILEKVKANSLSDKNFV